MKIAFLSFYNGVVHRGVETFVHELANGLISLGNDVTVYQIGDKLPDTTYKVIKINTKINWSKKGSYLPFLNYYALIIGKFTGKVLNTIDGDTDVIFPTNGQWQSILCSLWAKINNKKVVISGQSGPGIDDRINIWTFPDVFVSLTDFQKEWSKKVNCFVKSYKIPNGVNLKRFNTKVKEIDFGLPHPIVLCVSAFDKWKRQNLAIRATSKIKGVSLVLVGKGAEEKNLRELGKELLPGRFKIFSFQHKDMPKVYKGADLLTFPTVPWESFGIVLVEAMANKLPVVATNDPIREEIIGDAGILVDPTDIDDYAEKIRKGLRIDWGDRPRKQAEKFSWDVIAKQYESLFKKLIKKE